MSEPAPAYNAVLARCVLTTAGAGLDPRKLLREADVPVSVLTSEHGLLPSRAYLRLWEHAEFHQEAPDVGLRIANTYRHGRFEIFDYLFSTAATVGDGLAAVRANGAMATNHRYRPGPSADGEHTTVLELIDGDGRGADLTVQAAYASTLARIRHVTGAEVNSHRITLRQSPPRTTGAFVEAFGTTRIEFGAPVDSMTLRTRDLALPLRTADHRLADILRRYAASVPTPPLQNRTWPDRVQQILTELLPAGNATLATVAHRLAVSPRTLQRRLADADTGWRRELDRARDTARRTAGPTSSTALARRLGYSDTRALRRAAHRWTSEPPGDHRPG
ncbi:AraC family transcriptional regulator ligand-binding domain-containing protein [Nocardia aurantia]|uniref:HTH-type transcriptional regulator VirS n=1 Tax=Nocardia aurantia TaxID=2585199 RepID=A0A7K0DW89_9NOCA|nr:AraC family transcriptional regulator [Nocardia aurantia]MQY30039.1 HTH-type transcriptional regulator VirS [Nocardia aurantia]